MQRAAACNVARGLASNLTDSRGAHRARAMRLAACGAGRRSAAAAPQAARPPRFTGAWQRTPHASRLHAVAVLEFNRSADEAASASLAPRTPSYPEALAASLSRTTFTWAQLMPELSTAGAAPAADGDMSRLLEQQRCTLETAATLRFWEGSALSDGGDGAVLPSDATFVSETLAEWTAVAHQRPSGFDQEAQLALTGVADVAVVTRGGRARGYWKIANQDAFALSSPSPDTLLLAVCDGHGRLGEGASQAAATGLAAAMPEHLAQAAAASSNGSNGSATSSSSSGSGSTTSTTNGSSSSADAAQRALVSAFQEVASRMQQDAAFVDCGTAVAACLVQPGSVSVAWAGDCRAVLGLSVGTAAGPKCLVHSLTRDHKPESPLEQRRIEATSRGKVMQTGPERPFRIAARDRSTVNTLSLSRGFGDSWAVPLGFTAEADAVTLLLPPPAPLPTTTASLKSPTTSPAPAASRAGPLDSVFSSTDDIDSNAAYSSTAAAAAAGTGAADAASPAHHVLVLGCDGVWDHVSNAEAVAIAMSRASAAEAADALVATARRRWAAAYRGQEMDDVTAAVAFLPC